MTMKTMKTKTKKLRIETTLLFACAYSILFINLILVILHHKTQCFYRHEDEDWQVCNAQNGQTCSAPAVVIAGKIHHGEFEVLYNLTCPWTPPTTIVSYIASFLSLAFLVVCCLKARFGNAHSAGYLSICGCLSMIALVGAFVLMLVDMVNGHGDISRPHVGYALTFTQKAFVLNCVLVFVELVIILMITTSSIRIKNVNDKGRKLLSVVDSETEEEEYRYHVATRHDPISVIESL